MTTGTDEYRPTQYSVGQMLLDPASSFSISSDRDNQQSQIISTQRPGHLLKVQDVSAQHDHEQEPQTPFELDPSTGQAPFPLARLQKPFLTPTTTDEEHGQVDLVVFAEGIVQFRGKWFLYYGQADQTIGVATADVQP